MKNSLILLSVLFFSTNSFAQALKDDVAAVVNGSKISKAQLEETYSQNILFISDKTVTKEKVLNDLINREVGIQKAKKAGLDNDPVVKYKMEDVLFHAQVSKDLEAKLATITVKDDEVTKYYKENPEYRIAHILLRVRAKPEDKEVQEAQQQAMKIYKTLEKEPGKFAELANKYSQSNTAPAGGDLGFQPAIRLAPEVFSAIKGRKVDYITPPVRSMFGYHIVKVLSVKDIKDIDSGFYKKVIYDKKRDIILDQYFQDQRKGASIQINKKILN